MAEVNVERPRTIAEQILWDAVKGGEIEGPELEWNGPTKQPFLDKWEAGWRKHKARVESEDGSVFVFHYWKSTKGEIDHLKIKKGSYEQ